MKKLLVVFSGCHAGCSSSSSWPSYRYGKYLAIEAFCSMLVTYVDKLRYFMGSVNHGTFAHETYWAAIIMMMRQCASLVSPAIFYCNKK